jgi:hypothetical protein
VEWSGRAGIVIGVPTWCEAVNISAHTRRIDEALRAADLGLEAVIVNADNHSPDDTAGLFMATPTAHRKLTLPTARGKGNNEAALFEFALRSGAAAFMTLDADLEALPDDWVPALAAPILDGSADLVTPLYPRFWYDGTLTNQIVAPLVLAVTGVPIRQPIGGDFAFSPGAMRTLSRRPWPAAARGFGWDAYVVVTMLRLGLKVRQARLSYGKVHSWRSESASEIELEMETKFIEIATATLQELSAFAVSDSPLTGGYPPAPPFGRDPKAYDLGPGQEFTIRWWTQQRDSPWLDVLLPPDARNGDAAPERMDDALWARVLCRGTSVVGRRPPGRDFYRALEALFFLRLMYVLPGYRSRSMSEIDAAVHRLAVLLRDELQQESVDGPPVGDQPASP